ncbi:hypothetical protein PVAND_016600 [Polypedilum vanderplanki]|uniref:Peptidase C1A papain C-terminal domain-containing protein n=1 Tax=Polypedilum vanderplanki TaxID=319348 RepID=A0A9J6BFW6_POLVA|nr:hypothetical protein PVAND_016600 [Polypedilum vanderplanki]
MIERHNHLFRQGRYSYSLAINQFADQTNEEFIATNTGILPVVDNSTTTTTTQKPASHEHHENHHRHKRAAATWSVPSTFKPGNLDLRKAGIPVRNQGKCGSCWAHSAIGLLEYYYLTKKNWTYNLSEQQFVDCVVGCSGCGGGIPAYALNYALTAGTDFESVYPYKAYTQGCLYKPTSVATNGVSAANTPKWYTFPVSEIALAYAAFSYGWVSVCINANVLQFYSSGIIKLNQCQTGINHAVIVVGYGTDASAYAAFNYGWISVCINANVLQFYSSGIIRLNQCQIGINHAVIVVGYGTDASGSYPY